jgi:hypothetical protein
MTREEWLNQAVEELRPIFDGLHPLPEKIRVTCGFPSVRSTALKKRIGEHWSPKASEDQTHEILISPVLDNATEVFAVLVHELGHAATDGDGHQGRFPALMKSLHLEGKPSATFAGEKFKEVYKDLIDGLGEYPHAKLNVGSYKKQPTRMLKASCPACGYTVRLTAKWSGLGLPICPVDGTQFV